MPQLTLYGLCTSSSSFRVRIALNLKELEYDLVPVEAPNRRSDDYRRVNPQQMVPTLTVGAKCVYQSLAIMEFLEETFPGTALLPPEPHAKARVRAIAQYIVSEIQPLQNTRLDSYLDGERIDILKFKRHWITCGLQDLELMLGSQPETGKFCHGKSPTMADTCLVPQVWNAIHRYKLSLDVFPKIGAIYKHCLQQDAFRRALPECQPDFASMPVN